MVNFSNAETMHAQSLQSYPTLCNPMDHNSSVHGILQALILGWVVISSSGWKHEVKWSEVKSVSRVQLFATLWTVAYQDPPFIGFYRQEY